AIALLVIVFAALTLAPAILVIGSKFGLFDPKRELSTRGWRKVGTVVVRWPKPIIVVTCAIAIIGFISLLTYVPQYNDQKYTPAEMPANIAYAAADRHFSQARMNPELLMVEADHDLRNPSDMLVIDRIAKSIFHLRGIERVQTITRPLGAPIEHSSIPFQIAMQKSATLQTAKIQNDNTAQMLEQADELTKTIANMEHMYSVLQQVTSTTHDLVGATKQIQTDTNELRDHIADFDDFLRPLKNYFYWEPHCFDIPLCWAFRSLFVALDGIDSLDAQIANAVTSLEAIDRLLPQMITQLKIMTDQTEALQAVLVNSYGPSHLQSTQTDQTFDDMINVGNDFDQSRSDDFFYIPREAFDNEDVKTGMTLMMSPDGKAARFIVTHEGNAMGPEGIEHVEAFPEAIKSALKETSSAGSRIYIGGAASNNKDIKEYAASDLLIVAIAAFVLIFL